MIPCTTTLTASGQVFDVIGVPCSSYLPLDCSFLELLLCVQLELASTTTDEQLNKANEKNTKLIKVL